MWYNRKGMNPVLQKLSSDEVQSMITDSLMAMKEHDREDGRMLFAIQMNLWMLQGMILRGGVRF
jgi:hypothetical protein